MFVGLRHRGDGGRKGVRGGLGRRLEGLWGRRRRESRCLWIVGALGMSCTVGKLAIAL